MDFVAVAVLVQLGVVLVIAVVVVALVLTFRSGSSTPLPADPRVPVRLQGWLLPAEAGRIGGQFDESRYGTVALENGWFLWESNQGERWGVPVHEVAVAAPRGAMSFTGPGLDLMIRDRHWRLTVSDQRINRFSRNTAKTFRQGRRSEEFAQRLLANGARPM